MIKEIVWENVIEFSELELKNFLESFLITNKSFIDNFYYNNNFSPEAIIEFNTEFISKIEEFFIDYHINNILESLKINLTDDIWYQFSNDANFAELNKKNIEIWVNNWVKTYYFNSKN